MGEESGREKRSSVIIRALVRRADGARSEHRVRNLSPRGACLDHAGELPVGTRLFIQMGAVPPIGAEVMWSRDRLAGVRLDQAIDLQAARKPRGAGAVQAGWMSALDNAYRR